MRRQHASRSSSGSRWSRSRSSGWRAGFPAAPTIRQAFWRLLVDGVDATGELPDDRFDLDACFDPDPDRPGCTYVRAGGFLPRRRPVRRRVLRHVAARGRATSIRSSASCSRSRGKRSRMPDCRATRLAGSAHRRLRRADCTATTVPAAQLAVDRDRRLPRDRQRAAASPPAGCRTSSDCAGPRGDRHGLLVVAGGDPLCVPEPAAAANATWRSPAA